MIKNLGIFFPSMECVGGIENVILRQLDIFSSAGYDCYLITETEVRRLKDDIFVRCLSLDTSNCGSWEYLIKEYSLDIILINGAFASAIEYVDEIHKAGAKVVLTIHFSFPSPMLFNEAWACYETNIQVGSKCDAVVCVSETDRVWWSALGLNAYYIQNPFIKKSVNEPKSDEDVIIWVGRDVEQKQPEDALMILAEVVKEIPKAKLLFVGPAKTKHYSRLLKKLHIENNVEFYPDEKKVETLYARSKVHLLTSITESFGLVIAESKAFGLPLVMYDIPFLELIKDGDGVEAVAQHDVKSAAREIIRLLKDNEIRQVLSNKARKTLDNFCDEQVLNGWKSIFYDLDHGKDSDIQLNQDINIFVNQVVGAWSYQRKKNQHKIDFFQDWERIFKSDGHMLTKIFNKVLITPLRFIKNLLH